MKLRTAAAKPVKSMKSKLKRVLPHTFLYAVISIGVAWTAAVFILKPDADWETLSLYLMPFPITLVPLIGLTLALMLDTSGKIDLRPRAEFWCIFACTLVVSQSRGVRHGDSRREVVAL